MKEKLTYYNRRKMPPLSTSGCL